MLPVLLFPQFDPVLVHLGPLTIRWYALSYIAGIVLGIALLRRLVRLAPRAGTAEQADDFLGWVTLGVLLGGRLGYILFYQPGYYLTHPLAILKVWQGGMSFHGGALGVIIAMALFTWYNRINFLAFADRVTVAVPNRAGAGPDCQLHQWRTLGAGSASQLALGHDFSGCRGHSPPSLRTV